MSRGKDIPGIGKWACSECGFRDSPSGWLVEFDELTKETLGAWCPKCKTGGKTMTKSVFAALEGKKKEDPNKAKFELPPNARFEKTKSILKLLVPVLISILWSLSNIASYQMGVSAGRAKTVTDDILNRVAQDAFQEGVDKGYFEGLSKNISAFLPTSAVKGE